MKNKELSKILDSKHWEAFKADIATHNNLVRENNLPYELAEAIKKAEGVVSNLSSILGTVSRLFSEELENRTKHKTYDESIETFIKWKECKIELLKNE